MIHDLLCEHSGCNDNRSIELTAVESCSKAIFAWAGRHGKSPCLLRCSFLKLVGVDYALLVLADVHGDYFVECAL
jgi:hypothetical protein